MTDSHKDSLFAAHQKQNLCLKRQWFSPDSSFRNGARVEETKSALTGQSLREYQKGTPEKKNSGIHCLSFILLHLVAYQLMEMSHLSQTLTRTDPSARNRLETTRMGRCS